MGPESGLSNEFLGGTGAAGLWSTLGCKGLATLFLCVGELPPMADLLLLLAFLQRRPVFAAASDPDA